jgi:hypothetical protein
MGGEVELAFLHNKSISARIEVPYFGVIMKAPYSDPKIFKPIRKPHFAAPNAGARPIVHVAEAWAFRRAADGVVFSVLDPMKVCLGVTANNSELVFGVGNGELG